MTGVTAIEARVRYLESLILGLAAAVKSLGDLAGKAAQGGDSGPTGSGVAIALGYTTTAVTPRTGRSAGSGLFQFVNNPGPFTATGDPNDSNIGGYNVTGGAGASNAYCIVGSFAGSWYFLVLDCLNAGTLAPAIPPATIQLTQGGAALLTESGQALLYS